MRKISILAILFMMVGCIQEYSGENQFVCESTFYAISQEDFQGYAEIEWKQKSKFHSKDNFIYQEDYRIIYVLSEDVLNYLEKNLKGDKEALLEEFLNEKAYAEFWWINNIEEMQLKERKFLKDAIVLELTQNNPPRPKGWRGYIVHDKYNFSSRTKEMIDYEDSCEIRQD